MFRKTVTHFACAAAFLVSPWLTGHAHSQTLTMRDALGRALAASPRLTAAERDVGIATGLSASRPEPCLIPELSFELDNAFGTGRFKGTKSAETTLQLSQARRMVGKREARLAAGDGGYRNGGDPAAGSPVGGAVGDGDRLHQRGRARSGGSKSSTSRSPPRQLIPLLQRRVEDGASSPAETLRAEVAAALFRRIANAPTTAGQRAARTGDPDGRRYSQVRRRLGTSRRYRPAAVVSVGRPAIEANPQLMRWTAVTRNATPNSSWPGSSPIRTCASPPDGGTSTRPTTTRSG